MKALLQEAGRQFLKAFGASLVILLPGVLSAPNLNQSFALGVAALFASVASGLKVVQVLIPKLSFAGLLKQPVAAWVDQFVIGALSALTVSLIGILNAPDLSNTKAAVTAALVGALVAGFRALEGLLTKGETPVPGFGIK